MSIPVGPGDQARATAVRLQEARDAGRPIMLPGALPVGAPVAAVRVTGPLAPPLAAVTPGDLQRLEYRREGGGASGLRRGLGFIDVVMKFWRRR